ncbi:MAG: protein arginine kinase [Planctomycetes bacterium]|nr:protein arginine kinase [Planctomycetota bacterium]NOG54346.1 protein arginine kinase [Planctomycetota bacterium]
MTAPINYSGTGEWLRNEGPDHDVVVSSRVRLARNLSGFDFVNRADRVERTHLVALAREHLNACTDPFGLEKTWMEVDRLEVLDRCLLAERHLISKDMIKGSEPRAVMVNTAESVSVMVNEEDHYRIQAIQSGFRLTEAFDAVNNLDDQLDEKVQYAFHNRFGYLTACPTNVGTGIRISVMLHLPALTLTGEIERVRRAARDMVLAIRGFYGEGTDAHGDLYQVSNQTTLGKSEAELLAEFNERIIPAVIEYERQARQVMVSKRSTVLEDRCYRALGILTHARIIKAAEAMKLLSHLRLGIELGRITTIPVSTVNQLLLHCQPAHLQRIVGHPLHQSKRSAARADLIRTALSDCDL